MLILTICSVTTKIELIDTCRDLNSPDKRVDELIRRRTVIAPIRRREYPVSERRLMTHEEFPHHFEQVRGRSMNLARCISEDRAGASTRQQDVETLGIVPLFRGRRNHIHRECDKRL